MIGPKYEKRTRRPKQPAHVPRALLAAMDARDGRRSAWTGSWSDTLVPQHRQGGAGGRRDKHRLSNLVWLESEINGLIESDPTYQAMAIQRGIKISLHADPQKVRILHAVHGWVLLTDTGEVTNAERPTPVHDVPERLPPAPESLASL